MISGLLPIGTVVLLKNSKKRVMIIGVCQRSSNSPDAVWDYSGCLFPEGYIGADKVFLFNNDQIDKIYYMGLQDTEQAAFKEMADKAINELRNKGQQNNQTEQSAQRENPVQPERTAQPEYSAQSEGIIRQTEN